jgi:phytanoyl-CoA hydroxylase
MPRTAEIHPWNKDFSWRSPSPPFQVIDDDQASQFDRDGFIVLDSVIDADMLRQVIEEVDRYEADSEAFLQSQPRQRTTVAEAGAITFTNHLVTRSAPVRALATHPTLVGLCADLVGPDVNLYWDQAVYKKPEKPRRFPWHQDTAYVYVEPQYYLTCWVALTEATVENGCPWVAPGFHRQGTIRHRYVKPLGWQCLEEPPDAVAAPVAAGGVVAFSSLTPHMTEANTTDQVRKAYIVQYAPAGTRALFGDPSHGSPTDAQPCDDTSRQFPVLRAGRPVS